MALTLNEKTQARPKLDELKAGDILHIGTDDKGELFTVTKKGDNSYIFDNKTGQKIEYGRAVMNKNLSAFSERYKPVYWVTRGKK